MPTAGNQAVARGVPFDPIPEEYRDTNTVGEKPHNSQWINDNVVDVYNWIYRKPQRGREIIYYP